MNFSKQVTEAIIIVNRVASGVMQIQINRPQVFNALNTEVMSEISIQMKAAAEDTAIRAIVLTGNARAFAAGADIAELQQAASGNFPEEVRQQAWKVLREFPKPIIAAVSGFALGGGCELMMVADIVVASRTAQFGQPEINLGIIPGAGGTQRLTRLIGKTAAMKLNLTGEFISADEALRLGLITEVVEPELYLERSIELAKKIASKSSHAAKAVKASVLNAYQTSLEQGLNDERALFLDNIISDDAAEGVSAFVEKRRPIFPSNRT